MFKDFLLFIMIGIALVLIINNAGCARHNQSTTTPVVSSRVLDTSDATTVTANGDTVFERTVQCPSDGDCNVEVMVPIEEVTTVKISSGKRSCFPDMAYGSAVGVLLGAAIGWLLQPNEATAEEGHISFTEDGAIQGGMVGFPAGAFFNGMHCYLTR